jgi:sugar phosphate isomerase/epimerase
MGVGVYPDLSISWKAGRKVADRFGLMVEAPTVLDADVVDLLADLVLTAHAPYSDAEGRFSIADVNDEMREAAIGKIAAYIEDAAGRFPKLKKINMHCSPKYWASEERPLHGRYERLIDAVRHLANVADKFKLELMLENNRAYWEGVPDNLLVDQVDRSGQNVYFGVEPGEWRQIQKDVSRSNVFLCLDPSHACTYAQTFVDVGEREAVMMAYLEADDVLQHVHWNGNDLVSNIGRQDSHLCIGTDTLPVEFHRQIKGWQATLLLEHFYSVDELETELAFIERL